MTEPTKRQLDALAAWWKTGGSNVKAADMMDVSPQVVRNLLMQFRREERADTNLLLALRYRETIEKRKVKPSQHPRRKAA